ncbi:MAG: polysaccharide deacetylase family protein [Deltaproteobacteria bacterium]|nr:polysaccharide deacetylase family protein [Candidatus Zymogenaceae bacterium]
MKRDAETPGYPSRNAGPGVFVLLCVLTISAGLLDRSEGTRFLVLASLLLLIHWWVLGIFWIRAAPFGGALCRLSGREDVVALTFDDGPHPDYTGIVLDVLARHGARATFFVSGRMADEHPDIIRRIVSEGHEIGNHTMHHRHLISLQPFREQLKEIEACQRLLVERFNITPRWFRPPMGYTTQATFRAARRLGLMVAGWHVKGWDTFFTDPWRIVRHVSRRVRPGSIVLLHDGTTLARPSDGGGKKRVSARFHRNATITALDAILNELSKKGLSSVTLTELVYGREQ